MKKISLRKVHVVIMLLILIMLFILYRVYPMIYGKLFSGNHIKLDLSILGEDKEISLAALEIKCVTPQNQVCQIQKEGSEYSVEGGMYGRYVFTLTIPMGKLEGVGEDINIELQYLNANSWYISENKCVIDIRVLEGMVLCNCDIDTKYNDGTSLGYSEAKQAENGRVKFSWGN